MAVWVNEVHYDNGGADTNEGIEIAGTAGTDLTGWTIVLYNGGTNGTAAVTYTPTTTLSGIIPNQSNGFGTLFFPIVGLQNGSFDGFALVNASGVVVQFLSYEGVITATNGPAAGMTSTDIGVSQSGAAGQLDSHTLQLQGTGDEYSDFTWAAPLTGTRGAINTGQSFAAAPPPAQTLAIADASVTEGNSGTSQISFTVTRANGTTGAVEATWTVSFGAGATDADAGDFAAAQALTGTVSFADGESSKTILLDVAGDTLIEETETFTVTLSAPTNGAALADATATGTITNDDFPVIPTASIGDAAIIEGNGGATNLVFTVTLSAAPTGPVTIDFATSGGSATAGSDYTSSTGQVTFAAGETSKTISVPIIGDTVGEQREAFTVTLSNPSGATLNDATAIGTINDDDGPVYHVLAGGALTQDWSNTNLITVDDDWSNVPSIIGYRGDDLTTATGTNPQTLTGTSTVVDVIANQNVTTSNSGGVAEFQIADPTIGLQGSGTADAPHIVLYLDSSGREEVTVSYRLRDLDGVDNAVQQVALQYRTGGTGAWIDVPQAYTADATTGPNLLGPDTLVTVTLPAGANNQPRLEVRIITTNAVGNDEWVGIDDIQVTSLLGQPSLAIADASVGEGNSGTTPITFTVTRTGDSAGTVTADYTVVFDGSATASDFDAAEPLMGTVTFADGETSKTIVLQVAGDSVPESDETFTVNLTNVVGGTATDTSATGTIVNDDGLPPSVTINDVSQAEGNAGTSTFTFTVTRSGGTQPFTVEYVTTGGTATAGGDYETTSGSLTFEEGETSKTISVTVNGDTNGEPNETFNVQLFNPTGFAVIADATGVGTIVNDDPVFIHDIQGTAYYSPILTAEGKNGFNVASTTTVIVQAVVTALDDDGNRQGFYITEETDDWDAFASSSEGIFVQTRNDAGTGDLLSIAAPGLKVGDIVTITAQVMEVQSFNTMPRTTLVNATSIVVNGTAPTLPTLVLDANRPIPNSILTGVTPDYTDSADGEGDTFDVSLYGLSFWESVEGMLVTIPDMVVADGFVQTSGGQPYFQAYSTLHADPDQINDRGGYTVAGDPPLSPPDTDETDDGTTHGGRHLHDGDVNPDIIEVDFSGFAIDAPAGLTQNATMGDKLGDVTGIVEFDFTDRKLFVTQIDPAAITNDVPVQETTELGNDTRALTVATFNVENLDPGDGAARFAAIADAIANNLNAPDIITIEEMQDNNGATATGGSDASVTWQMLVDALNAAVPGANYQWVDQAPVPGGEGGEPGGNIRVGFLYNTNRVQLGDLPADATIEERRQFTDRIGDGTRDAGDRIAFSDDMVGGEISTADWSGTRLSLLGQFTFNGNTVYVTANHWPAKGGSGEFWQFNQNLEAGDPDNSGWAKRNAVAQDVYSVLNHIETNSGGAGVVAGGDFNDFYFYRPLEVVTGYVTADGNARNGGARFDNLTITELTEAERYTYTFDGRSQAIDHIIVNQTLSAVASYDIVHLNTGYNSRGTGADANPALSDHDPAVSSFDYRSFAETLTGTAGNDNIDGFGGNDTIVLTSGGDDVAAGGAGDDLIYYGAAFTNADSNDGGEGTDRVGLAGDYSLTFDADDLVNIERLELYGSARVGGMGTNDYNFTTVDANVAAGTTLFVTAASLSPSETLVFNGMAETNGKFIVHGGAGADTLVGGALGDFLIGNAGNDLLFGLGGDDFLVGDAGADQLRGGFGRDTYRYLAASDSSTAPGTSDRLVDFEKGQDKIDLSAIDAGSGDGDQAFTFIGSAAFTGAGQVRSTYDTAENAWRVEGDIDGDGNADFAIYVVMPSTTPLNTSDFIL